MRHANRWSSRKKSGKRVNHSSIMDKVPRYGFRVPHTDIALIGVGGSHLAESFIGRLRDECLNETLFASLPQARTVLDAWRVDYNRVRPHSALANRTPEEFRTQHIAVAASRRNSQNFQPRTLLLTGGKKGLRSTTEAQRGNISFPLSAWV